MRINKYLASSGLGSRRKCEEFVNSGKVTINGKVETNLAFDVSEKDKVCVDGVKVKPPIRFTYLMMHKPKGYLTSVSDDRNRKTVMELLPNEYKFLMPVGRLDYNSEGLLIFTNDGDTAQNIMRPSKEVVKTYQAKVEGEVTEANRQAMEKGVTLIDGTKFKKCKVKIIEIKDRKTKLEVQITEGKNREIRKIFDNFGYNVIFLKRVAIGEIKLGGLTRGTCRLLHSSEIEYLKSLWGDMKVAIIGGGASGMMCATMIARKGHNVTLFEKNEKLGKKIYITGKGRCNVTNATVGDTFLKNVVNGKKFVMGAITRFNSNDTINFFNEVGVPLKIERGNRVFPESDKSSDIISGLEKAMRWAGVEIKLNLEVQNISVENGKIVGLIINGKTEKFDAVVVATGGVTYPATGSTGDGYKFAKSVGHTIIEPVPALCAVRLKNNNECKQIEGLSLKNVKLYAKLDDKIVYQSDVGEMLFTSNGISGPLVLSMSSYINRCDLTKLKIYIDFKPGISEDGLLTRLDRDIINLKAKQTSSLFEGLLPRSLIQLFAKRLGLKLTEKANQITKEKRKNIAFLLKNYELEPISLENFESSVVTAGGINLKEINPKYMKSKLVDNLYFVGEVLDIDALTGGFNLQLAFSTAVTCASDFKDIKE